MKLQLQAKLFMGNPLWGDTGGAGQALWSAGTLERRHVAFIVCHSDRRAANKRDQHVCEMFYSERKFSRKTCRKENRSEWRSWERHWGAPDFRMLCFCCGFP